MPEHAFLRVLGHTSPGSVVVDARTEEVQMDTDRSAEAPRGAVTSGGWEPTPDATFVPGGAAPRWPAGPSGLLALRAILRLI